MTAVWITVAAVGLATMLTKAAGTLLIGDRALPPRAQAALEHLAPALLAALVGYETLVASGGGIEVDARLVGVAFAAAAVAVRAPLLAVVSLAAIATATARLLT